MIVEGKYNQHKMTLYDELLSIVYTVLPGMEVQFQKMKCG